MHRRVSSILVLCLTALTVIGCAAPQPFSADESARLAALLPTDALLLGEQHDAAEHQQLERRTVQWLAARGELAALVIEMAEQGRNTAALPPSASQAEVRAALAWQERDWPWASYGPMVMAAVRAHVPVLGANLPHARLRAAMPDATLDARVPPAALQEQVRRIRAGHCNALPQAQLLPMTRMQIARDIAMAETVAGARLPGRTVLLVAGNGHVHRALGVPLHLAAGLKSKVVSALAARAPDAAASQAEGEQGERDETGADLIWPTPPLPPRDYCAQFKRLHPAPA